MRNVLISHPYPPKEKRWAFHCMFSLLNHPTYPPLKVTSRSDLLKHRYLKQLGDGKPPFLPRKIPWERGNPPRPLNPNKNKHSKGGGLVENRDGNDHGFACVFFWGGEQFPASPCPTFRTCAMSIRSPGTSFPSMPGVPMLFSSESAGKKNIYNTKLDLMQWQKLTAALRSVITRFDQVLLCFTQILLNVFSKFWKKSNDS